MKRIIREKYLNSLIRKNENGLIKIVTGFRRSGKSFLLDQIYKEYLINLGIEGNPR